MYKKLPILLKRVYKCHSLKKIKLKIKASKKRYDFIFSLGQACSCTQVLRDSDLQCKSYPLDWLFGSDLKGRIDIVASKFQRFLEMQDLVYTFSERSIFCDAYHNTYNDLTFNHDFLSKKSLNETFPAVSEKYNRRIQRLLTTIEKSRTILGVYIEIPCLKSKKCTFQDLIRYRKKLNKVFPNKRFDLLYICPDNTLRHGQFKYTPLDGVDFYVGNYQSLDPKLPNYMPDFSLLSRLMKQYQLNIPIKIKLKKQLLKCTIKVVPIKSIRKKLRKKYHVQ